MTTASLQTSAATPAMRDAIVACADTPVLVDYVRALGPDGIKLDVWYCNTHVPALRAEYPLRQLRRYAVPSRAAYLVIGELDVVPDGHGSASSARAVPAAVEHHERFVGQPLGTQRRRDVGDEAIEAAVVYPAMLLVPDDRMQEVGRWYDEEHLPFLLSCPQWLMTRRFRIADARGLAFTHVALHYLSDLRALQSPERDAARNTPWRDSLIDQGWFTPEYRLGYRVQDFN
jgi:hypothetical protein